MSFTTLSNISHVSVQSRKCVCHSLLEEIVLTQYRSQYNNSRIHRNGQHFRTNSMFSLQDPESNAEYAYGAVFFWVRISRFHDLCNKSWVSYYCLFLSDREKVAKFLVVATNWFGWWCCGSLCGGRRKGDDGENHECRQGAKWQVLEYLC